MLAIPAERRLKVLLWMALVVLALALVIIIYLSFTVPGYLRHLSVRLEYLLIDLIDLFYFP